MTKHRAELTTDKWGSFKMWHPPIGRREYVVGVDTAEGVVRDRGRARSADLLYRNDEPDYSAAIVIEKSSAQHVASWWGTIEVTDWLYVAAANGYFYNRALIVPEINGPGIEVINGLSKRLKYPNLYRNRRYGQALGDDHAQVWGWRTSPVTRPLLIARVTEMLNASKDWTKDAHLIRELRTMERDESGVARAKAPNKDDRVMALAMALQARHEALYGDQPDIPEDKSLDHLPPDDKEVWRRWLERQEQVNGTGRPRRHRGSPREHRGRALGRHPQQ